MGAGALLGTLATHTLATTQAAPQAAALAERGATVQAFVPVGWQVELQQRADLNRDGLMDVVVLLRQQAPPPASGAASAPRRQLLVLTGSRTPRGYRLSGHNDRLVPQPASADVEDPMADGELLASRGQFSLKLSQVSAQGSYASRVQVFRFRVEPACARLVHYTQLDTQRATLDTDDLTVDYLSGRVERSTGNAQTEATQVKRQRIAVPARTCLGDLPDAFSFQPPL